MLTINNTIDGAIQDIEIKGNTVQDPDNLSDIKSVGELQEDGTYKMSILSCGKNLINNSKVEKGFYVQENNSNVISNNGFTTSNYIKIKPNTKYVLNKLISYKAFYDRNKNIIPINPTYDVNTFTTPTNASYVRISVSNANDITTYQLEEGTVATSYEPYQENKCDILLPCQLEKVGDVSDRLYYDDVEKAWCIEKNVETIVYNGTESWISDGSTELNNKFRVAGYIGDTKSISNLFLNTFWDKYNTASGTEFISTVSSVKTVHVSVLKSKCPTLQSFKEFLGTNNLIIKTIVVQPQFIPLPRDTQIQLNSFFGTTHVYMESGEVEGTIKCKIPKSLGATVQSLNNKTDILSDRIEAIEGLKDSQNMKYETDKGYLVCKETKNGVIDDLKIEGKTLVNRTDIFNKVNPTGEGVHQKTSNSLIVDYSKCGEIDMAYSFDETNVFKSGRIYTIIIDIIQNTLNQKVEFYPMIWDFATVISGTQDVNTGEIGRKIFVIKANKDYALKLGYASPSQATQGVTGLVEFKDIMVLDGDYTNIELPNYFEGLMSVGEDVDKIEVLSTTNKKYITKIGVYHTQAKPIFCFTNGIADTGIRSELEPYLKYFNKCDDYDSCNNLFDYYIVDETTIWMNLGVWGVDEIAKNKAIEILNRKINECEKSDKKQILFYNENGELEPVTELHEWDSIEKHSDNKWYYHKRSGKVVLNGSEDWQLHQTYTNCLRFAIEINTCAKKVHAPISDKFIGLGSIDWNRDMEHIIGNVDGWIHISILKTKLSSQDVEGFKQWLQANNVTVVYQLAQEEVYELAPLHLDSYANETLILCNSGAISPKMEFSITSHINELVKAYGERINLLEEKVYKYMVTQNRMQLASTYSADSVTFKVDYFSLCGNEENYDEDLYNLILNNILVGKDNYDYDKMFTMILDYASWNQISWEQFDILVGLMDIQHNPPVEELPTEDVIEEDIIENEETPVE